MRLITRSIYLALLRECLRRDFQEDQPIHADIQGDDLTEQSCQSVYARVGKATLDEELGSARVDVQICLQETYITAPIHQASPNMPSIQGRRNINLQERIHINNLKAQRADETEYMSGRLQQRQIPKQHTSGVRIITVWSNRDNISRSTKKGAEEPCKSTSRLMLHHHLHASKTCRLASAV